MDIADEIEVIYLERCGDCPLYEYIPGRPHHPGVARCKKSNRDIGRDKNPEIPDWCTVPFSREG